MSIFGFLNFFYLNNLNMLRKQKLQYITLRSHQIYLFHNQRQKQKQMQKHFKQQSRLWDYAIIKKLGKGTSGEVFQVINKTNQKLYALKKMTISGTQQKQKIQAFKQIKCLSLLSHPSIIEYKESFLSMDNIYIVMEYASRGDFSQIIEERRRKQKFYTEDELWKLFEQIVKGVKYLHEKSIIHRDLKLENIFMTEGGQLKIGDLGMAKILSNDDQLISTRVGTPVYFAPQIIQNQLYSFPVDVWSLGCVLYFLTTLQHPFQQATIETLAYYAIEKGPKPIKGQYSIQLINFISDCLEKDVKTRPNIFELAIRLKNIREKESQRHNKVSIFNINHLKRILTASGEHKISAKSDRKIITQRNYSQVLRSPKKIYTSLNQRPKFDGQMNAVETRNIRSSADSRNFFQNKYFIDSPESFTLSPSSKKKLSHPQIQSYRTKKLVMDDLQDKYHSPFIKTNGFSLQMVHKKQSPQKFCDPQLMQGFNEKPLLVQKAFSRRSHR